VSAIANTLVQVSQPGQDPVHPLAPVAGTLGAGVDSGDGLGLIHAGFGFIGDGCLGEGPLGG